MNKAIVVREKITRLVALLTQKRIKVTQRGSQAFVRYDDAGRPSLVNIPYIPDDADDDYLGAIEGFLDHEVAHVLYTDYSVLKNANSLGLANLHNIIEDSFIERKMAANFPGTGTNLGNVGRFFLTTYTDQKLKEEPENAVSYLMVPAIRALGGQVVFRDYMEDKWAYMDEIMSKAGDYLKEAMPKVASSQDGLNVAIKLKELLCIPDEPPASESDGKSAKGSGSAKGTSKSARKGAGETPKSGESGSPGDIDGDTEIEEGTSPTHDEGATESGDEETPESEAEPGEGGSGDAESEDEKPAVSGGGGDGELPDGEHSSPGTTFSPSEFDAFEKSLTDFSESVAKTLSKKSVMELKEADYCVFTKDLDKIEPLSVDESAERPMKAMIDEVDHMIGPLQKDLERAVAARSAATFTAGHRSGKLHASSLARLTAFKDERVFRRKHVSTTKDVAVCLLIDCSGSMSGGGKIKTAAFAGYGLAAVLDRLNISTEVLGFTTQVDMPREADEESRKLKIRYAREEALYIPIIKDFGERLTTENKKRFASLSEVSWLSQNVDGECVQIAATRLAQRREKRKILIVLSDGQPCCGGDGAMQIWHLKNTVKEVEKQGIEILGIGICSASVKEFYPKYVVLNNVSELPGAVIGRIKSLMMK